MYENKLKFKFNYYRLVLINWVINAVTMYARIRYVLSGTDEDAKYLINCLDKSNAICKLRIIMLDRRADYLKSQRTTA